MAADAAYFPVKVARENQEPMWLYISREHKQRIARWEMAFLLTKTGVMWGSADLDPGSVELEAVRYTSRDTEAANLNDLLVEIILDLEAQCNAD